MHDWASVVMRLSPMALRLNTLKFEPYSFWYWRVLGPTKQHEGPIIISFVDKFISGRNFRGLSKVLRISELDKVYWILTRRKAVRVEILIIGVEIHKPSWISFKYSCYKDAILGNLYFSSGKISRFSHSLSMILSYLTRSPSLIW